MNLSLLNYFSYVMMLWNFLFAFHLVSAEVIREDGYNNYEGQFTVKHKGRMLRVLMFFHNIQLPECALHCVRHLRCRTFNYNHNRKDCELTEEDFNAKYVDMITSGWYNYGTPPKVNGGWNSWKNFTWCTKKCGNGTLEQWRDCDSPKPAHGGAECEGRMRRTVKCNTHECIVANVARGKTATQSSVYNLEYHGDKYAASKAIDGSYRTWAYTENEYQPWWEVDLGEEREIKSLYLRVDFNLHYYNLGLLVKTRTSEDDSWTLCKDIGDMNRNYEEFTCDKKSTNARFLKIQSTKRCYLRIYEVGILGY